MTIKVRAAQGVPLTKIAADLGPKAQGCRLRRQFTRLSNRLQTLRLRQEHTLGIDRHLAGSGR